MHVEARRQLCGILSFHLYVGSGIKLELSDLGANFLAPNKSFLEAMVSVNHCHAPRKQWTQWTLSAFLGRCGKCTLHTLCTYTLGPSLVMSLPLLHLYQYKCGSFSRATSFRKLSSTLPVPSTISDACFSNLYHYFHQIAYFC